MDGHPSSDSSAQVPSSAYRSNAGHLRSKYLHAPSVSRVAVSHTLQRLIKSWIGNAPAQCPDIVTALQRQLLEDQVTFNQIKADTIKLEADTIKLEAGKLKLEATIIEIGATIEAIRMDLQQMSVDSEKKIKELESEKQNLMIKLRERELGIL